MARNPPCPACGRVVPFWTNNGRQPRAAYRRARHLCPHTAGYGPPCIQSTASATAQPKPDCAECAFAREQRLAAERSVA